MLNYTNPDISRPRIKLLASVYECWTCPNYYNLWIRVVSDSEFGSVLLLARFNVRICSPFGSRFGWVYGQFLFGVLVHT